MSQCSTSLFFIHIKGYSSQVGGVLIEGPADGGSDVEIVASVVSLDKKQSESRNVNMYRQEERVKASDQRECLP